MFVHFDSAILLLEIYPKDIVRQVNKDVYEYSRTFTLSQQRMGDIICPSVEDYMLWFIHTKEYSSDITKYEINDRKQYP